MTAPKHLWSGGWADESAAAAARRRGARAPAGPSPADQATTPNPPAPPQPDGTRSTGRLPRTLASDLRRRMAGWDPRRVAVSAAVLLVVAAVSGTAVALLDHGGSKPASTPSVPLAQVPPGSQANPGAGQGYPNGVYGLPGGQSNPGGVLPAVPGAPPAGGGTSQTGSGAWLGVDVQPTPAGVVIEGIVAGGPADAAALRPGDLLLAINNHAIGSLQDLSKVMSGLRPGQTISVHVRRDNTPLTRQLTLGENPNAYASP